MIRNFLSKSPIFRHYTWSRCTYYLRVLGCRQISESASSQFDPGSQKHDTVSPAKENIRGSTDTKFNERKASAPVSRIMDRNPEDLYRRYLLTPDQPENARILRVAIIGSTNAGKSTLVNTLMGWKVNGVSKKVHTTRQNANTVFTIDNVQIILVDTPGIITRAEGKKHNCNGSVLADPERSFHEADAVGVIVDVENKWTRNSLNKELQKFLYLHKDVPSFLILNKIDTLRNRSYSKQQMILLDVTRQLCEGVLGGKEFGQTILIEREKVKERKKSSKEMFDKLETQYGKLNVTRKPVDGKDSNTVKKERLREEISDILKNSNLKASEFEDSEKEEAGSVDRTGNKSVKINIIDSLKAPENGQTEKEHEKKMFENNTYSYMAVECGADDKYSTNSNKELHSEFGYTQESEINVETNMEITSTGNSAHGNEHSTGNSTQGNEHNLVNSKFELSKMSDSRESEMNKAQYSEITDTLSSDICDSEKAVISESRNKSEIGHEVSGGKVCESEATDLTETTSSEDTRKYNFEDSYQSEFLERILSQPPLPEFCYADKPVKEEETNREVRLIQEAVAAVRGKRGWEGFQEVFLISALDGTGIDLLKDYLVKISKPGDWVYHSSVVTDQHPYDVAKMCVTQSLLDNVDSYLPYVMEPEIIYWDVDSNNRLNISVEIKLKNTYEMGLLLKGGGASRIRVISASARQALMDAFQCEVQFKLALIKQRKRNA